MQLVLKRYRSGRRTPSRVLRPGDALFGANPLLPGGGGSAASVAACNLVTGKLRL